MNTLKRFILSLSALMLMSGAALTAPVLARDAQSSDSTQTASHVELADNKGGTLAQQFRQEAKDRLEAAQTKHQERTQEQRQTACTARKANLTKRMANAVSQAKRHKQVIDNFYTKVKNFYVDKQLNVSGYADLTAKVDAAQASAQTSIDALSALEVNVDCTSQTVAASVSAFQSAVKSSRDSLKDYRSSLVDLITALKGASSGSGNTSNSNPTDNAANQ
jgi:hypothetical protein